MTPPTYNIGDRPTVSGAFADVAGAPATPTAVTVKVIAIPVLDLSARPTAFTVTPPVPA